MSAPTQQLPDQQTAMHNLYDGLHNHVFFSKLAAAGHSHGNNEKRASAMLELALKLEAAEVDELQKAGSALDDPYCAANAALDSVLTANGLGGSVKSAAAQLADRTLDDTVAQLCQDPTLYDSALAIKTAEAKEVSRWLQQQAAPAA